MSSGNFIQAESRHLPFLVKILNSLPDDVIRPKYPTNITEQTAALEASGLWVQEVDGGVVSVVEFQHDQQPARITRVQIYGAEILDAMRKVLNRCFNDLGRNKVSIDVLAGSPALKIYESLGFRVEVRKRQHFFTKGKPQHVLELAIRAQEFHAVR